MLQLAAHLLFHRFGVGGQIVGRVGHRPGLPRGFLRRLVLGRQQAFEHVVRGGLRPDAAAERAEQDQAADPVRDSGWRLPARSRRPSKSRTGGRAAGADASSSPTTSFAMLAKSYPAAGLSLRPVPRLSKDMTVQRRRQAGDEGWRPGGAAQAIAVDQADSRPFSDDIVVKRYSVAGQRMASSGSYLLLLRGMTVAVMRGLQIMLLRQTN